jgi:hypothetical protein
MTELQDLRFPLIVISDVVSVCDAAEKLGILSEHAERGGYLRNALLLTREGTVFRVASYVVRKQAFWSRPKTPFGRGIQVGEIRIEPSSRTLDEVKKDTSTALTAMSEILSEAEISEDAILSAVASATDYAALARCLCKAFAPTE